MNLCTTVTCLLLYTCWNFWSDIYDFLRYLSTKNCENSVLGIAFTIRNDHTKLHWVWHDHKARFYKELYWRSLNTDIYGVLHQNNLEGDKLRSHDCNLQVITLRNDAFTIACSLCLVRLRRQSITVTIYMSKYNFKTLKHTLNKGNIAIISSLRW